MRRSISAFLFVGLIFPGVAYAGQQIGTVIDLRVRASDGLQYVSLSGTHTNMPACAGNTYWMIKDENSTAGKAQLAMLMTAITTGRQVLINGAGTCTRWVDGEDINEVKLYP